MKLEEEIVAATVRHLTCRVYVKPAKYVPDDHLQDILIKTGLLITCPSMIVL